MEDVPAISTFYGITVKMYFRQSEHNPPHIHATYAEYSASIDINTLGILDGYLPPKALMLVLEWMSLHHDKLVEMWETQKFEKVDPLL